MTDAKQANAIRAEIAAQAEAIANMRGITPETALRDIYGAPLTTRLYCGPPDECPNSALPGVLFTAVYLTAALKSGVSWKVAQQTLAAARKRHR
jgi:hypothetical protein